MEQETRKSWMVRGESMDQVRNHHITRAYRMDKALWILLQSKRGRIQFLFLIDIYPNDS